MDLGTDPEPSISSSSLESKIHSFLQGNPAFSTFDHSFPSNAAVRGKSFSPAAGTDNREGTPVRDEGGGTPTQDEMMDKPVGVPYNSRQNPSSVNEAAKVLPVAFESNMQKNPNNPQHPAHPLPGSAQNGQVFQPFQFGKQEMMAGGTSGPAAQYQHIAAHPGRPAFGEGPPGGVGSSQTVEGFQRANEQSWFGENHPEGGSQQPGGYNMSGQGIGKNRTGLYPYQTEQTQEPQEFVSQQGPPAAPAFFRGSLPPVPKLPPPPPSFDPLLTPPVGGMINPPHHEPPHNPAAGGSIGSRGDGFASGMAAHDHQRPSSLRPDDMFHDPHRPQPPENFHPHQEDERYHDDSRQPDEHFFCEDPYYQPDEPYFRPGSPPRPYPRGRGHLSPPRDPFFEQQHNPRPPRHYALRRPPPPRHEMRHLGQRPPPPRPPHLARHPHPRGSPRPPFPRFNGPDPMFRGKRPGPRGGGPMFPPKRPFPPPRY